MNKTIPNEKRREAATMYSDGASKEELMAFLGCHEKTVDRLIEMCESNDGDVDLPSRGGDRKSPENLAEIIEAAGKMIEGGGEVELNDIVSVWEEEHGVERRPESVRLMLKKHDLKIPPKKSPKVKESEAATPAGKHAVRKGKFLRNRDRHLMEKRLKQKNVHPRIKRRYTVLLAVNDGQPAATVASCHRISSGTVCRWRRMHRDGGLDSVSCWGYAGQRRNLKLDRNQSKKVVEHVLNSPKTNLRLLRVWISEALGVTCSASGVHNMVRRHGFIFRRSKLLPKFPSLEKQQEFIDSLDSEVAAAPAGSVPVFMDGFHPGFRGETGGRSVVKGTVPAIQQATGRDGLNILGALNAETGQLTYAVGDTINRETVIELLAKLKQAYHGAPRINAVLDNVPYHRAKDVKHWIENQSENSPIVRLLFLPAYCPHLNLIERLWKKFREKVTRNRAQENIGQFREEALAFLDGVSRCWDEYGSYVNVELKPMRSDQYLLIA